MKHCLILLLCGLLLTACGDAPLRITTTPAQVTITQAADPAAVQMLPVQIRVVNRDNLNQFLQDLRTAQSSDNPVFIALTTQDYENLALNIADLRRYIQQQQSIIVYYRGMTGATTTP
jgi:hypothetical protein